MMIPKTYAVLSDALDEGCGHAATKAIEIADSIRPAQRATEAGKRHASVAEAIRNEVLNAICERFDFDDLDGQ